MPTYKTPGVYVEEISTLPPSVAEVSTAIPAFIGYTEKGPTHDSAGNVVPVVARISTMLEYQTLFGTAYPSRFAIALTPEGAQDAYEVDRVVRVPPPYEFCLYYSLSMYFQNGGGSCYIISIGNYDATPSVGDFEAGLDALEQEDEPTLIVLTEAVSLGVVGYYALCTQALNQCKKLGDRFTILDVVPPATANGTAVQTFRDTVSADDLSYGAAYHLYLQTTLNYAFDEAQVAFFSSSTATWQRTFGAKGITVSYTGDFSDAPKVQIARTVAATAPAGAKAAKAASGPSVTFDTSAPNLLLITVSADATGLDIANAWQNYSTKQGFAITTAGDGSGVPPLTEPSALDKRTMWQGTFGQKGIDVSYVGSATDTPNVQMTVASSADDASVTFAANASNALTITVGPNTTGSDIVTAWQNQTTIPPGFAITTVDGGTEKLATATSRSLTLGVPAATLTQTKSTNTALYNQVKAVLAQQRVVLPPSAAIAGIYARVDRDRGVWKAPANVSLAAVLGPVAKITQEAQENLNIDPTAGKSINAIRAFTGKGTLVWGARTLDGNSNEWRYVPVRRLFIMIEESVQKASAFAVFEPNDAATWLKVKAMIESYLYGLWEQGALAGPTPDAAYVVNVGLGKTMTTQDVLEGRMIVEIGIAAVRPAEFIVLRFSHKLQQA